MAQAVDERRLEDAARWIIFNVDRWAAYLGCDRRAGLLINAPGRAGL